MKKFKSILVLLVISFSTILSISSFAESVDYDFPFPFFLDHDATIQVPGGKCVFCSHMKVRTIQDALKCLDNVIISPEATVTIEMVQEPKPEDFYDTIKVNHPNGDRIHIIGNCDDSACTIRFNPNVDGVNVLNGHILGLLDGFSFIGHIKEGDHLPGGIAADAAGQIILGPNIKVQSFHTGISAGRNSNIEMHTIDVSDCNIGIYATMGATINITDNIDIRNCQIGIYAAHSSTIRAVVEKIVVSGTGVDKEDSYGIYAIIGSNIVAAGAEVSNFYYGAGAFWNSYILVDSAQIFQNHYGATARYTSSIQLLNANIQNNNAIGVLSEYESSIIGNQYTTSVDNGDYGFRAQYNAIIAGHGNGTTNCTDDGHIYP